MLCGATNNNYARPQSTITLLSAPSATPNCFKQPFFLSSFLVPRCDILLTHTHSGSITSQWWCWIKQAIMMITAIKRLRVVIFENPLLNGNDPRIGVCLLVLSQLEFFIKINFVTIFLCNLCFLIGVTTRVETIFVPELTILTQRKFSSSIEKNIVSGLVATPRFLYSKTDLTLDCPPSYALALSFFFFHQISFELTVPSF